MLNGRAADFVAKHDTSAVNAHLIVRPGTGAVQDLEIIKGYVPGYSSVLGHEFVGIVEKCDNEQWVGKRVSGEINCLCESWKHPDPIMVRNHAPKRVVLGIINKDGCTGEYITLPVGRSDGSGSLLH